MYIVDIYITILQLIRTISVFHNSINIHIFGSWKVYLSYISRGFWAPTGADLPPSRTEKNVKPPHPSPWTNSWIRPCLSVGLFVYNTYNRRFQGEGGVVYMVSHHPPPEWNHLIRPFLFVKLKIEHRLVWTWKIQQW